MDLKTESSHAMERCGGVKFSLQLSHYKKYDNNKNKRPKLTGECFN